MNSRLLPALMISVSALCVTALAQEVMAPAAIGPDQLGFSFENMDPSVSPAVDFNRYSSGAWHDRAVLKAQSPEVDVFSFMHDHVQDQMIAVIDAAATNAGNAPKGSPAQQVGDFYNAFMDVDAINAAGMTPMQPLFDDLASVSSLDDLATYIGQHGRTGSFVLGGVVPSEDKAHRTNMVLYFISGSLGPDSPSILDQADGTPGIEAYRAFIAQMMQIAGDSAEGSVKLADLSIAIERDLRAGQITPVEANDPRNTYNPVSFAEMQAEIPQFDLALLARGIGLEPADTIVQTEPRYLAALSKVLETYSLEEIKQYLRYRLVSQFSTYLSTDFQDAWAKLDSVLYGISALPPREELVQASLTTSLGQPLSHLYVDAYFKDDTRQVALEMIGAIKEAFLERMQTRSWLTDDTRTEALDKLERLIYRVGYPDEWIDYSSVEINPADPLGNIIRLGQFGVDREVAKMGKPVVQEQFSNDATLPMVINAAYNPAINGFEVPAAILQPGLFDPDQPAAVYLCRLGAVIGHEMTHGFDSGGRLFDADGNLRDWWASADAEAFNAEAQKLVDQADAFEVLPGVRANGALNVKENMADFGGITLAHAALLKYLEDHPDENVEVNGFTPSQLCFIAWGQMWATKATDQYTSYMVSTDVHAPGKYRSFAPLQHIDAFYDAFSIKKGDPMWLAPEKRVKAW